MSLPLHLFAGWLLLFYVGNWVGIIYSFLGAWTTISTLAQSQTMEAKIVYVVLLVSQIVWFVLTLNIQKIVKIKEENIPRKIVRLLTWRATLSVGILIIVAVLINLFFGSASSEYMKEIVGDVTKGLIGYLIWASYFMQSKRVAAYYGKCSPKIYKF
jgi:hypothetical protein